MNLESISDHFMIRNKATYPNAIHINQAHMNDTQNRLIALAFATCGEGGADQPVVT